MLTLIQAARLVGPYAGLEATLRQLLLKRFLQFRFRGRIAASARIARRTLVSAYEDVLLELWHHGTVVSRILECILTEAETSNHKGHEVARRKLHLVFWINASLALPSARPTR